MLLLEFGILMLFIEGVSKISLFLQRPFQSF